MSKTSSSFVTFQRPDGQSLNGYLAIPENTKDAPSIVVIQEWWGLNDQIRGVADRFASLGYFALVPDLYRGKATVEQEEAHHLMDNLNFGDAASQDIRGAVQYLRQRSEHVGLTGYCMGAALALLALTNDIPVTAAAIWYGCPPLEYLDATKIRVPVIGHWATQDTAFPIGAVNELEDKLHKANVDVTFYRYLAMHAFANETAVGPGRLEFTQYDPVWAQLAWDRTLTFFGCTLW